MVFIGRPAIWGLGQGGEDGLRNLLGILKELVNTMALSGYPAPRHTGPHCTSAANP